MSGVAIDITEATTEILVAASPAEWLRLADMYIVNSNQMPESYVLPSNHAMLSSVIERFHSDPNTFVEYIQVIRDQFQPGDKKTDLQVLYRTILTRVVQQSRRSRLGRALAVLEIMLDRRLGSDERERAASNLEQNWAHRRLQFLKLARGSSNKGRLSPKVRANLLKEFWAELDNEIERRDFSMFNHHGVQLPCIYAPASQTD